VNVVFAVFLILIPYQDAYFFMFELYFSIVFYHLTEFFISESRMRL